MIHIQRKNKSAKYRQTAQSKQSNEHTANMRYVVYSHFFLIGVPVIFVTFMPYLMDYYVFQPNMSFWNYCNLRIVDRYYNFEMLLIALAVLAIWSITRQVGTSLLVTSLTLFALAYASSIKHTARGELFRLSDLKLTEAAGMALRYLDFDCSLSQLTVISMILFFCIGGFLTDLFCRKYPFLIHYNEQKRKLFWGLRIIAGCVCFAVIPLYTNLFINNRQSIDGLDIMGLGSENYVLYNFLRNDRLSNITIENTEESYHFFRQKSAGFETNETKNKAQYPSVIVIMNESWWNTDNIISDNITFSSDPMEPYKRLEEECSFGYLSANIYGGGTVSSEAEFLTGLNTKYFLSDIGIYSELEKRKIPSIVDYFHDMSYETISIHPYYGEFYDRDVIYPKLGFDKIIFEEDMQYTDIYSQYISDGSMMNQIIKEYQEKQNKQQFIFAVSIANHIRVLDYKQNLMKNESYPISISLGKESLDKKDKADLINYINGIYLANEAFSQLVSYFSQEDDPVVIVMYGDHAPSFSKDTLALLGLDGADLETQKRLYSVPVLMWNNFKTSKIHFSGENINYLPQIVLEYAGLPESDMAQILRYERNILKSNTRKLVEDSNGQSVQVYNEEQLEAVRHFKVIDYDILFGDSSYRNKVWKPFCTEE